MKHPQVTRRTFQRGLLAAAVAPWISSSLSAADTTAGTPAAAGGPPDFSIVVLGDTHFDRPEDHDMDWLRREKPGDVKQSENYSRITADVLPSLLREARDQVARAAGRVPFAIHLGDVVEGLCGTEALARKQCEEAMAAFTPKDLGVPLVMTKGNHDITGPGAVQACDQVLLPNLCHPAAEQKDGANYVLRHAGWWFVFFDAYRRASLAWLEKAVKDHRPEDPPLVFVIHPPVIPYTARCWHVYNRPADAEPRARLLRVLASHRAVVLNGHLHKYGWLRRSIGDGLHLDQLSLISVVPKADVAPKDERSGVEAYGPSLTDLEPKHSPETLEARRKILAEEKPFVTRYEYADLPGYAVVHFRAGGQVTADVYRGVGQGIWRTVQVNGGPA